MAEYDFIAGPRKGKVCKEKYYLRNNKNFIQEAKKYIPINSQWLTKEEFKNYIISLLDKGIPQIYVLQELPEELYPYALIFVQNQQGTSIYVDKEGVRTQINIGDNGYDAVDIVDNIPQNARNNTIYFVNQPATKNKNKNVVEYDLYVCENNVLKQIVLKSEESADLTYVKEVCDNVTSKCLKYSYNIIMPADCNVTTDNNGYLFCEPKTHLYLHHYHYDKSAVGEVNFMIYSTKATQLNNTELGDFLIDLGCDQYWRGYPAYGQGQRTGGIVSCIFAKKNSGGLLKYTIYVGSYTIGNAYQEDIGNYLDQTIFSIVQIF